MKPEIKTKAATAVQSVMVRYHPKRRELGDLSAAEVLISIPDMYARLGRIACYAHIGQHSEADMRYYYDTIPISNAPLSYQHEAEALVREYRQICRQSGQDMKIVKRDTKKFHKARYGWFYARKGKANG